MFITQYFLAFSGWPEIKLLLELKDLITIEKSNTLYYIPNAIAIKSKCNGEFFFGSFIDRDICFALLTSMSQVYTHTCIFCIYIYIYVYMYI
jgi:hypothetical protein